MVRDVGYAVCRSRSILQIHPLCGSTVLTISTHTQYYNAFIILSSLVCSGSVIMIIQPNDGDIVT